MLKERLRVIKGKGGYGFGDVALSPRCGDTS